MLSFSTTFVLLGFSYKAALTVARSFTPVPSAFTRLKPATFVCSSAGFFPSSFLVVSARLFIDEVLGLSPRMARPFADPFPPFGFFFYLVPFGFPAPFIPNKPTPRKLLPSG